MTTEPCFETCDCVCGVTHPEFDRIAAAELARPLKLDNILRAGVGWYVDRTLDDSGLDDWDLSGSGVYIVWHKSGYCPTHDRFHMRALYIGKGAFKARLKSHWSTKATQEELLLYFTHTPMENRLAKYVEQLLLDLYNLPLNKRENLGTRTLCAHFTQREVD